MDKNRINIAKFAIGLGITGVIAGIFLIFSGENIMGFSSSVASAGIVYIGFGQLKKT